MDGSKTILWIIVTITGAIGAYLPTWLWHADPFGFESIFGGFVGGIFGIWIWAKYLR